jgi:D-galactarolactone cycloisomerase
MQRRDFLKTIPAAAMLSAAGAAAVQAAPRLKITDIRLVPLKTAKEGTMEPAWTPGYSMTFRVGGGSYLEIHTDAGLVGIGPNMEPTFLKDAKTLLVGKDPFDIENIAGPLRYFVRRGYASIEIALWDLIGKAAGQPLYKLWGAKTDKVLAYCSFVQLSKPDERARLATEMKAQGWKAIKIRLHHETMREDIITAATVRKAVGDDFRIMVDANQAQNGFGWQPGVRWDYRRALDTARELEKLGIYWLEEPLNRYDWDSLAELNASVGIPIVGGENNVGVHEFRTILQKKVFDIVQPDVMVADGVTGLREIAALADSYGKLCIPHHGGGNLGTIAQLHAIASFPNAPYIEILNDPPIAAYTVGFGMMENPPLLDKDGYMPLPQGPGLGVDINKALLA